MNGDPVGGGPVTRDMSATGVHLRRPVEADHAALVSRVDEWWGGRALHWYLPRLWFQHFTGTSWLAEDAQGRPIGFLVGFVSADHPDEGYIHMVGTDPNHRRGGLGRALYERFFDDMRDRGIRRVSAVTWPGNRGSVAFHRALGFQPAQGVGTQNLYGTPAYPDYDADGDDRVVFTREL
jgi:GNAT superfamily N-acetyltransferase